MEQITSKNSTAEALCVSKDVIYIAGVSDDAAVYWRRNINNTFYSETKLHERGGASAIFIVER